MPPDPRGLRSVGRRELTNSTRKMADLLDAAGFGSIETKSVEWLLRWDVDDFRRWRRGIGPSRRRLATLDPERRETVFREAAEEIAGIDPEDFVNRDEVVMAWGVATA